MSNGERSVVVRKVNDTMYYWCKEDAMLYRCSRDELSPFMQLDDPSRIDEVVEKFTSN